MLVIGSVANLRRCALECWYDLFLATHHSRQHCHALFINLRVKSIRYQLTGGVSYSDERCFLVQDVDDKEKDLKKIPSRHCDAY